MIEEKENKMKQTEQQKERPIIFSTDMVRAILDGRKTQTRRVVTVPKSAGELVDVFSAFKVEELGYIGVDTTKYHSHTLNCPYGKKGDLLWVRACRLKLKIKNIRVERVQDISETDAWNEGAVAIPGYPDYRKTSKEEFAFLWDETNKKRGYGWETNPFVWVIEFEK